MLSCFLLDFWFNISFGRNRRDGTDYCLYLHLYEYHILSSQYMPRKASITMIESCPNLKPLGDVNNNFFKDFFSVTMIFLRGVKFR